jgi:hypothetical protein
MAERGREQQHGEQAAVVDDPGQAAARRRRGRRCRGQREPAQREPRAAAAQVPQVDLEAGEEEQERQPDGGEGAHRLVRLDDAQDAGAETIPARISTTAAGSASRGTDASASGTTAAIARTSTRSSST